MNITKVLTFLTGSIGLINMFLLIIALANHEYEIATARASATAGWFTAFLTGLKLVRNEE